MFSFDPPLKEQKTKGFLMFSGESKGNIRKKKFKTITKKLNTAAYIKGNNKP